MTDLKAGWLDREFKRINVLRRTSKKLVAAYDNARRNGYREKTDNRVQVEVSLSMLELSELIKVGQLRCFAK